MKKLFQSNDKYLKIVDIFIKVLCIVLAVLLLVGSILCFALLGQDGISLGMSSLISELFIVIGYILWKAIMSFFIDVKYIRNKIYNLDELNYEYSKEKIVYVIAEQDGEGSKNDTLLTMLEKLREALECGAITQEEFEEQKKELLK